MIVFRSEVGPDVMMFDEVGSRMLELMGKEKDAQRGVVTVEQMPGAIARLKAAVAADKATHHGETGDDSNDGDEGSAPARISLTQRALPLIELLEISLARKAPVLWGV